MKKYLLFPFALLVLMACKKPITEPNSGIYRGPFFQIYDNGDTNAQGIAVLALSKGDIGGTFTMTGDTNTGAPYSCYGNYIIDNSTKMTFYNSASVDVGYQPYYLLDTSFIYTFNDVNFTLNLVIDTTEYQYILKRI